MNDFRAKALYLGHAVIVWFGGVWQTVHIYSHQSAEDLTLVWVVALLISEVIALPLALKSKIRVWILCHVVGGVIIAVLVAGVVLYS